MIKKLLVIKEICFWLQTFRPSNPGIRWYLFSELVGGGLIEVVL